jgi:hypothetical protein
MVMGANAEFSSAVPVVHQLQSGLVGPEQSFYIPVNQMMTAGGFALQVELTLADDVQMCYSTDSTDATYEISNCAWELELLELSQSSPTFNRHSSSESTSMCGAERSHFLGRAKCSCTTYQWFRCAA